MSIVTMDMSSFEIVRNDSITCGDDAMLGRPLPALQQQTASQQYGLMPQHMIALDTDAFMKRMYAIEIDAEVFLKNSYQH